MAFGLPPLLSKKEIKTHKKLTKLCCEVDLLTDDLFVMDANSVSDDARYFVFGVISFVALYSYHTFILYFSISGKSSRGCIVFLAR